jgi:NAD(P)-dependent dehydrogenase (short-subunit alcohol dehydrogenase family)
MKTPALFDLTSRVAIVTGGNGGIGRGIALGLAEADSAVAIFGRNEEKNFFPNSPPSQCSVARVERLSTSGACTRSLALG